MVAIPIGYDQPGVAARIAYHGVGEFIEIGNLTARHLSELIVKVKANPNYRDKARWFQKVLGETRGLDMAAGIIERVFGADRSVGPESSSRPKEQHGCRTTKYSTTIYI
jgi:UDP:flavonoid glycosyltransferase YjiC (YdhE family)